MAVGQTYNVTSGTAQQYFIPSGFSANSLAVLNPNDGVCYIARNRNMTAPTNVGAWDYKVPSQSYALLPGPYQSAGVWYVDQSGSNRGGEITLYPVAEKYTIPTFQAIGRAVQVAGSVLDISQGNQPANPPLGTSRLWIDGNGVLNVAQPDGTNHVELDSTNYLTYVGPAVTAGTLGGDLYGTVGNGHVWAHTQPLQLDRTLNLQWGTNANNDRITIWSDANMYLDLASGIFNFRQAGTTLFSVNNGNVQVIGGGYTGTYQPTAITLGDSVIQRWNSTQFRMGGSGGGTGGGVIVAGPLEVDTTISVQNGANSPGALLVFPQNIGNKICFYDTGSGNSYGVGVQSNFLEFYTGGTSFGFKPNATGGAMWLLVTSAGITIPAGGQYLWSNGPYLLNSGNDLLYRSLGSGYHYFQNTGGGGGQIVTGGATIGTGALDCASAAWVRCPSTVYMTSSGDRMVDGGDNNNWVFYGPMGSVNFVFQHRDGSWMGTQAANFQTMSDFRLKFDVVNVSDDDCVARLRTPGVPVITWATQNPMPDSPSPRDIGFVAQDMATAVPEVVSVDTDGNHFLSYGQITAVLWGALRATDATLQAVIAALPPGMRPPNVYNALTPTTTP